MSNNLPLPPLICRCCGRGPFPRIVNHLTNSPRCAKFYTDERLRLLVPQTITFNNNLPAVLMGTLQDSNPQAILNLRDGSNNSDDDDVCFTSGNASSIHSNTQESHDMVVDQSMDIESMSQKSSDDSTSSTPTHPIAIDITQPPASSIALQLNYECDYDWLHNLQRDCPTFDNDPFLLMQAEELIRNGIDEIDNVILSSTQFTNSLAPSNINNENVSLAEDTIQSVPYQQEPSPIPTHESANVIAAPVQIDYTIHDVPLSGPNFQRYLTDEDIFLTKVSELCTKSNLPHHIFDDIVNLFRDVNSLNLKIRPDKLCYRKHFISRLEKRFTSPVPKCIPVTLESSDKIPKNNQSRSSHRDKANVIVFDFKDQVYDLLHNPDTFGNMENLIGTHRMDDPFNSAPIEHNDGRVDEIMDGQWYKDTYEECKAIAGDEPFVVYPVIMYMDKTGTDVYNRSGLEPLLFTLCNLNRSCRNRYAAWRMLGINANLDAKSSAQKSKQRGGRIGKGRPTRNYHTCLKTLIESYMKHQGRDEPIRMFVRFGNQVAMRRVFFPFAFIIGDSQSQDKVCGRYLAYTNVQRTCRCCDVPPEKLNDHQHKCNYVDHYSFNAVSQYAMKISGLIPWDEAIDGEELSEANKKVILDESAEFLKNFSHHLHDNAFADIWFGHNTLGLLEKMPHDLMHAFQHGVLHYVIEVLISPLNPSEKVQLDELVDSLIVPLKSSSRSSYPKCSFMNGITNLSLITADERVGVAFVLLLVASSKPGAELLKKVSVRIERNKQKGLAMNAEESNADDVDQGDLFIETDQENPYDAPPTDRLCDPNSIIYMLSMMLCFHAWYHYGAPYNAKTDVDVMSMRISISEMLKHVKLAAPRTDKSGWNIQKFHNILHIPRDIQMYGSPMNYDASTSKNNLKFFAKQPGEHTQKGTKMHIAQTCIRLRETDLMMKAISTYRHSYPTHFPAIVKESEKVNGPIPNNESAIKSVLVGGPHFTITVSPVDGQSQVKTHQGLKSRTK